MISLMHKMLKENISPPNMNVKYCLASVVLAALALAAIDFESFLTSTFMAGLV
jgi:hypothetical protein